jgi:hypothetical protein
LKLPEHHPLIVEKEIEEYNKKSKNLEIFKRNNFTVFTIIEMDATLHPDLLYAQIETKLHLFGFSLYDPYIEPIPLDGAEGGFHNVPVGEAIKFYSKLSLGEMEPERKISEFGHYCPVEYHSTKKLVSTSLDLSVHYRVKFC